ncbi:MAG: cyclase family protein [Nitrospinae bacterium]|nr:cyclase family protein [Nitrospinota bacterium]
MFKVYKIRTAGLQAGALFLILTVGFMGPVPGARAAPKLIDLTHTFDEHTIYWPTNKSFTLAPVHKGPTSQGFWYEANNYEAAEHGGTHLDAPVHFAQGQWTVDQIPLSRLIAPGVLVDVSAKAKDHPDTLISRQDMLDWEQHHGRLPKGVIVLVRTGWEAFWPDKKKYLGSDRPGETADLHFPGFSEAAARFLTRERNVAAVGLDTASLDYGRSKVFKAHQVFGAANVPGFENLHNLDALPAKGFRVIALPMKIGGGSGAPLRIVAEIP